MRLLPLFKIPHPLVNYLTCLSIMFWNCQGATSKGFRLTFRNLIKTFNPAMVVVLEPRINGRKADAFIKNSGFECSHRVEAEGFSGGI